MPWLPVYSTAVQECTIIKEDETLGRGLDACDKSAHLVKVSEGARIEESRLICRHGFLNKMLQELFQDCFQSSRIAPKGATVRAPFKINENRIMPRITLHAEDQIAYLRAVLYRQLLEVFPHLGPESRFERPSRRPASQKYSLFQAIAGTVSSRQY